MALSNIYFEASVSALMSLFWGFKAHTIHSFHQH